MPQPTSGITTLTQAQTTLGEMLLDVTGNTTAPQLDTEERVVYEQTTLTCLRLILNNESDQRKTLIAVRIAAAILNGLTSSAPESAS